MTAARAFVRSLNILLKFAKMYDFGHPRTTRQYETAWSELQTALEENPYYRHAVGIGQLAPVEVALLDPDGEPAWQLYENRALEQRQKCGDIKPSALDRWTGWPERFAPLVCATSADTASDTPTSRPERR